MSCAEPTDTDSHLPGRCAVGPIVICSLTRVSTDWLNVFEIMVETITPEKDRRATRHEQLPTQAIEAMIDGPSPPAPPRWTSTKAYEKKYVRWSGDEGDPGQGQPVRNEMLRKKLDEILSS